MMRKRIYYMDNKGAVQLVLANEGFHWLTASVLAAFILFCFFFPILVIWFTTGPIGFGFIITILIFWGTGFYSFRLLLWNKIGKEIFQVSNGQIEHYYDYGIFKDNFQKLKSRNFSFGYMIANEPNEFIEFIEDEIPNETDTFFPAFIKNKELILSDIPVSFNELLVFREFAKKFTEALIGTKKK